MSVPLRLARVSVAVLATAPPSPEGAGAMWVCCQGFYPWLQPTSTASGMVLWPASEPRKPISLPIGRSHDA